MRRTRRGFTLIEAMAAVVILGIGIVMAMGSFSSITHVEDTARGTERMQRMAQAKLAELVATGGAASSTSGDFTEEGEPDVTWSLEVNTSGITDLNAVSITVQAANGGTKSPQAKLDTLVFVPETTTATTSAGGVTQ